MLGTFTVPVESVYLIINPDISLSVLFLIEIVPSFGDRYVIIIAQAITKAAAIAI